MTNSTLNQSAFIAHDTLTAKLDQLSALLAMTYGHSQANFDELLPEVRDSFMWACSDLARDCRSLLQNGGK